MTREAFEQLLSDWLAEPQRADLREQVEQAVAGDAGLARLRDQHVRLAEVLRGIAAVGLPVAWERMKARVSAAIDQSAEEGAEDVQLEQRLRGLPGIEGRVDWPALRRKIGAAIDQNGTQRRIRRFSSWRISAAAGLLAAAAALALLMVSYPPAPVVPIPNAVGRAVVQVLSPLGAENNAASPRAVVRVQVMEESGSAPEAPSPSKPASADVYFTLEPPTVTLAMAPSDERGSH